MPGPYVLLDAGKHHVVVEPGKMFVVSGSLEKASLLTLAVYYIKNITYPRRFGQVLGFLQGIVTGEHIEDGHCSQKLLHLKSLFPAK